MFDISWQQAVKQAEALKALGEEEIYLSGRDEDMPWHLAQTCEPGGSHRLDMSTSVWFRGGHLESGLRFRWSFDIEDRNANGKPGYRIDIKRVAAVAAKLPLPAAQAFREYLADSAKKVRAAADEYLGYASRQYTDAHILDHIAQLETPTTTTE